MNTDTGSKQRILLLNAALHIGGAEKVIASLALGLRDRGHQVTVCTLKRKGEIGRQLTKQGIPVINLANPESRRHVYTTFLKLAKIVRERRIDIVHTHSTAALWEAMLAKSLFQGARLIHTFHFGNYPFRPWQLRLMERIAWRRADQLVAVGFSQREAIAATYGIEKRCIEVVLNGVDKNEPNLDEAYWRTIRQRHSVIVGSVSTLTEQKGLDCLVRVAKSLRTTNIDFAIIIVGEGPLRAQLEAQVQNEDLSDMFYFTGWANEAAATVLPALDIFVQPSRWEAMSIVILEAMAAGLPVVATDVGDNNRVIVDGETGFVVTKANEQEFGDRLARLVRDPALRKRMGIKGSRVLQENYSEERMIDNYVQLYYATMKKN